MVKQTAFNLKKLLVNIAALSLSDQRWLLQQLSAEEQALFHKHQGNQLLAQARRFSSCKEQMPTAEPEQLPTEGHQLAQTPELYLSIILEQGQFSWQSLFLEHYPQAPKLLHQDSDEVKLATKSLLFQHWQQKLNESSRQEG